MVPGLAIARASMLPARMLSEPFCCSTSAPRDAKLLARQMQEDFARDGAFSSMRYLVLREAAGAEQSQGTE